MLTPWLHLIALVLYLGSVVGLWAILLPAISSIRDQRGRAQALARSLKFHNPMQVGTLGLVVFSGALQLTDLKAAYRELLPKEMGSTLGWKLALSFGLILLSVYLSMALGHRFVKRFEAGEALSPQEVGALFHRLKVLSAFLLILTLMTSWLGVRLRG